VIEIRWTPQAADDLQAIHDFIARDSVRYAQAEAQRIVVAIDQLIAFPNSGRIVPERPEEDLRELVLPPYRIVYRLRSDAAMVLTIFRADRLLPIIK
jgi:plasmid stabilization system protein ParE